MAGILAWAADVVGGAGASDDEADDARAAASAAMTPDQRLRAADLDARAASLRRVIQDLRLRVPPPHVAQRLPHLHAHSLASSAALVLQLNAHSSTKEQYQGGCSVLFRWLTTPEEDHRRMIRHVWADDEGHFNQNHNDWDSFPFYGRSIYNLRAELGVLEPEGNIPGIAICVRPGWIGRLTLCSPTCLEAKTLGHRRPHHRVASFAIYLHMVMYVGKEK